MSTDTFTLRACQTKLINGVHELMRQGKRVILAVLPTGGGKRMVIVWWAAKAADKGRETLIVTDRRILVQQASDEMHRFGVEHGVVMSGYEEDRTPHVQICSLQTIEARYKEDGLHAPSLIMIDEAHKNTDAYSKLIARFPAAKVILLTATPVGSSGATLIYPEYADSIFEGATNSELIRQGLLLPTLGFAPSEPNLGKLRPSKASGEFPQVKLGKQVSSVTLFADLFAEWAPFADRKTIVFAPSRAYCYGLANGLPGDPDSFRARGIKAEVIESKTTRSERERILQEFNEGDLKVLVSVDVLREGFDAPIASCAIDLQPCAQLRTYWQKLGRIKRSYPGQEVAVYIDLAGNYLRFLHPDDDPDWLSISKGESSEEMIRRKRKDGTAPKPVRCPKCAAILRGPKCRECGHTCESNQEVRMLRMGNGKLKKISAVEHAKKAKTDADRQRDKWKSTLFIGLKTGKTLKQCQFIHKQKHGDWPAFSLPCMPANGSAQWSMRVEQVYDARTIMREFERKSQ